MVVRDRGCYVDYENAIRIIPQTVGGMMRSILRQLDSRGDFACRYLE